MNADRVFLEVFGHVQFPKLAVDLERLESAVSQGARTGTQVAIPISAPGARRTALVSAWRGMLRKLDLKPWEIALLATMLPSEAGRKSVLSLDDGKGQFQIGEMGGLLIWAENSPWPAAYSTFIEQLAALVNLHGHLISEQIAGGTQAVNRQGFDASTLSTVSEYPRQMPTEVHYAMASLGAWLAGAANIQYLSYYATIRQITHRDLNVKYALRMGYSQTQGEALHAGGCVLVPQDLHLDVAVAQNDGLIFGSLPIDEFNLANLPGKTASLDVTPEETRVEPPGLMLDRYYRAPFFARKLGKHALYGARDVLRDHYTDFYNSLSIRSLVRCKHYCAPIVNVGSLEELRSLIARIPLRSEGGLFFRGQGKLHPLPRSTEVQQMLFGDSCSQEPSLVTAAARERHYNYDAMHFALRLFLEQKIALQDRTLGEHRLKDWRELAASPLCALDRAIMALAQHYGIPTHGLDITRDPEVATWFAVNRWSQSDGNARYDVVQPGQWPAPETEWPVVVACQAVTHSTKGSLHDCEELRQFGFGARRPTAQAALFFQGGHSDHANRLAETVMCVFRLAPAEYRTRHTFATLFPTPGEDPAYRVMLEFADSPQFGPLWGRYVNRFH